MKYRLFPTHKHSFLCEQLLQLLAISPNSDNECAINAVCINRYQSIIKYLSTLSPSEMKLLSNNIVSVFEIHVDMQRIADMVNANCRHQELHDKHMDRCKWLIANKASNSMILQLCYSIEVHEIKQLRIKMNMPVSKGRCKSLLLEDKLSVIDEWQKIMMTESDEFIAWQKIAKNYPQYDLAQLYSTIIHHQGDCL